MLVWDLCVTVYRPEGKWFINRLFSHPNTRADHEARWKRVGEMVDRFLQLKGWAPTTEVGVNCQSVTVDDSILSPTVHHAVEVGVEWCTDAAWTFLPYTSKKGR